MSGPFGEFLRESLKFACDLAVCNVICYPCGVWEQVRGSLEPGVLRIGSPGAGVLRRGQAPGAGFWYQKLLHFPTRRR